MSRIIWVQKAFVALYEKRPTDGPEYAGKGETYLSLGNFQTDITKYDTVNSNGDPGGTYTNDDGIDWAEFKIVSAQDAKPATSSERGTYKNDLGQDRSYFKWNAVEVPDNFVIPSTPQIYFDGIVQTYGDVADYIVGSPLNDLLKMAGGNDTTSGGSGADVIYGNQGSDVSFGNQGSDTLFGGQGSDTSYGGQDNDIIYGNFESDLIYGNLGNDVLYGGQGNDTVFGGQGNDTLIGGAGNDLLIGNMGADVYRFDRNSGQDIIRGFNQAEGDRISLGGQGYSVTISATGDALLVLSGGGTIELAGVRADQVTSNFFAG